MTPDPYKLYMRAATYRTYEAARRAFYKWVAKRGLYRQLVAHTVRHAYLTMSGEVAHAAPRVEWRRDGDGPGGFGATPWARGYPTFDAPRSEAMRQWEREFERHREWWLADAVAAERHRAESSVRPYEVEGARAFFEMAAGAAKIAGAR